jgi:hypothetical protein
VSLQLSDQFRALDGYTQNIIIALLDSREALEKHLNDQTMAITKLLNRTELVIVDEHSKTRNIIINAIRQAGQSAAPKDDRPSQPVLASGSVACILEEEVQIRRRVERTILTSLEYPTRTDRQEDITEAHQRTFGWIYVNPPQHNNGLQWTDFGQWLQKGDGIYWINGKAASGKSTLMRYICDNPKTKELLTVWADPLPPTTAAFFFWNSGTPEQRSQSGFLRSLLFEVCQQYRELIPIILPWLWAWQYSHLIDTSQTVQHNWSLPKLKQAFKRLVQQDIVSFKLCLFVDGLDEYDGDHGEIASLFGTITSSSSLNVKVCVSSRPLLVFDDAFGQNPSLRLQDLTYRDITKYVGDKLGNNPRFRQLTSEEPLLAPELTKEIVKKADGVFLWVTLVVKSLLAGLGNRDSIADLQRRLKLLPSDLEALYSHMVTLIDHFYLSEASQTFQLVRTALELGSRSLNFSKQGRGPLTTLELSFAIATMDNPNLAITTQERATGSKTALLKSKKTEDRLKVCCAGLLEVQRHQCMLSDGIHDEFKDSQDRIQYLHRTVRDYLEQPEIWATIVASNSKIDFDPYICLLQASVLQLKAASSSIHVWHVALTAFEAASHAEIMSRQPYSALIGEMNEYFSPKVKDWCSLYFTWLFGTDTRLVGNKNQTFLAAVVHYGLSACLDTMLDGDGNRSLNASHYGLNQYLDWKHDKKEDPKAVQARPLLTYIRSFGYSPDKHSFGPGTLKISALLLKRGCDPNEIYQGRTPWQTVLFWQREILAIESGKTTLSQNQMLCWADILRLFLQHGADTKAQVERDNTRYSLHTALDGLEFCGFQCEARKIRQLAGLQRPKEQAMDSQRSRWWTRCIVCRGREVEEDV